MSKLKNIIKELTKEIMDEMSTTGDVAGYSTRFAFSKGGKNKATKAMEKLGFKTVEEKMDPVGKEDPDVNNDGKVNKQDKYLLNRRKKIGHAIARRNNGRLDEETVDISATIIDPLKKTAETLDKEQKTKLEAKLKEFESQLQQKISGKIINFKGKKGDPYQAVKDYRVRLSPYAATPIEIENWPSKNNPLNFQIKIIGKQVSKDGKEFGEESNFFVDFSIPNTFSIGTTSQPVTTPQQPAVVQPTQTVPTDQKPTQPTQPTPVKPDEKTLDGQIAR